MSEHTPEERRALKRVVRRAWEYVRNDESASAYIVTTDPAKASGWAVDWAAEWDAIDGICYGQRPSNDRMLFISDTGSVDWEKMEHSVYPERKLFVEPEVINRRFAELVACVRQDLIAPEATELEEKVREETDERLSSMRRQWLEETGKLLAREARLRANRDRVREALECVQKELQELKQLRALPAYAPPGIRKIS